VVAVMVVVRFIGVGVGVVAFVIGLVELLSLA
jgi:hypothetical protein